MTPILLSGPATEPIALADAKTWLRVQQADEDVLIAALITSARLLVEAASGHLLITQNWRLALNSWPDDGCINLPLRPLQSLTSVQIYDAAGAAEVVDPSFYLLDEAPLRPRIRLLKRPANPGRVLAGIAIDLVAGFGAAETDVPENFRQAIRLLVAKMYENRGDMSGDLKDLPADVSALIGGARKVRLT